MEFSFNINERIKKEKMNIDHRSHGVELLKKKNKNPLCTHFIFFIK